MSDSLQQPPAQLSPTAAVAVIKHVGRRTGTTATSPQRYRDLLANPDTPRLVELYAAFAAYQAWTDRVIPVVVLEPR